MGGKVTGVREAQKALAKTKRRYKNALGASIYVEALDIIGKSLLQTPVDTGRLRQSHFVERPSAIRGNPTVRLGYGTNYARIVHERTDLAHKVGNAKFLKRPLDAASSGYVKRVGDRAKRFFEEGKGIGSIPAGAPKEPKVD